MCITRQHGLVYSLYVCLALFQHTFCNTTISSKIDRVSPEAGVGGGGGRGGVGERDGGNENFENSQNFDVSSVLPYLHALNSKYGDFCQLQLAQAKLG